MNRDDGSLGFWVERCGYDGKGWWPLRRFDSRQDAALFAEEMATAKQPCRLVPAPRWIVLLQAQCALALSFYEEAEAKECAYRFRRLNTHARIIRP